MFYLNFVLSVRLKFGYVHQGDGGILRTEPEWLAVVVLYSVLQDTGLKPSQGIVGQSNAGEKFGVRIKEIMFWVRVEARKFWVRIEKKKA